jgi:hypothetical protein
LFCSRTGYVDVYIEMDMITKKVWMLRKQDANETDATFLFGLDCKVEVKIPEPFEIESLDGKRWNITREVPSIKIETTCEKQEMMLKLKYGEELVLIQVVHTPSITRTVIPGHENSNMASHSRPTT